MKSYLEKRNEKISFEDAVLLYGMWKGYMEQPKTKDSIEFMQSKGVKLHILHTSGQADATTIEKRIQKVAPKIIVPVHTENAEFRRFSMSSILGKTDIYM